MYGATSSSGAIFCVRQGGRICLEVKFRYPSGKLARGKEPSVFLTSWQYALIESR